MSVRNPGAQAEMASSSEEGVMLISNTTPSYREVGEAALADLKELHALPDSEWSVSKFGDVEIPIFYRKSTDPTCCEDMLKGSALLKNTNLALICALAAPWLPYRPAWDDLLERSDVDVVTKARISPSTMMICSRSVIYPSCPETKGIVRTNQYLGAYVIEQKGDDVNMTIYFQSDLNMSGPKLFGSIVESIKPRFIAEKLRSLVKAVANGLPVIAEQHLTEFLN